MSAHLHQATRAQDEAASFTISPFEMEPPSAGASHTLATSRSGSAATAVGPDLVAKAVAIYRARRKRDQVFEGLGLFGEPAYDLMLDLYVATKRASAIPVSSACIASSVPATTALRYIDRLQRDGLIERTPDPFDKRRRFIVLSASAIAMMEVFLAAV